MSYIKLTNGVPEIYSIGHLRRDNPNISFPKNISDETLSKFDVYQLETKPEPSRDELTETTELKDPVLVDGKWIRDWEVKQVSQTAAESNIRTERDRILSDVVDSMNPMRWESLSEDEKTKWKTYRQELLDITAQEGFPYSVTWPTAPEGV